MSTFYFSMICMEINTAALRNNCIIISVWSILIKLVLKCLHCWCISLNGMSVKCFIILLIPVQDVVIISQKGILRLRKFLHLCHLYCPEMQWGWVPDWPNKNIQDGWSSKQRVWVEATYCYTFVVLLCLHIFCHWEIMHPKIAERIFYSFKHRDTFKTIFKNHFNKQICNW